MKRKETVFLAVTGVFLLLAALCRFVLPGVRFSAVLFLGLAVLLLLTILLGRLAEQSKAWKRVRAVFYAGLILVAGTFVGAEAVIFIQGAGNPFARPDAVIVLGAGVNGKTPSLALQTRLEAAAAYLKEHPDIPAVLSGGQGPGEEITEARAMYTYLTEHGISPARLLLEEKSTDTEENFADSKALMEENGIDTESAVIAVVTNDFHLCRARLLAARAGLTRTAGVPAKLPWLWLSANYYVREYFALAETLLLKH